MVTVEGGMALYVAVSDGLDQGDDVCCSLLIGHLFGR